MPTLLLSFKRNSDSEILIHGALAPNETRSEKMMEQHASDCPKFGPAFRADETIQVLVDVDEIPDFDQESIEDWLDDIFAGLGGDLAEEQEEDGEEEEDDEDFEEGGEG